MLPIPLIIAVAALLLLTSGGAQAVKNLTRKVKNRENAEGCDARLQAALDAWEAQGEFDIVVADEGGLRTDEAEQEKLFASGLSRAANLASTAHGRGAALDLYPDGFDPHRSWAEQPLGEQMVKGYFYAMATFFESRGLVWGGRWKGFPDWPHFEVPDWQSLPFPPNVS